MPRLVQYWIEYFNDAEPGRARVFIPNNDGVGARRERLDNRGLKRAGGRQARSLDFVFLGLLPIIVCRDRGRWQ